ncbi:MAG: O-antigen ligase family protein [Eubacteriales bacterium]|nr:O-antigen ligase family protein [Eubacteriales bacterium]
MEKAGIKTSLIFMAALMLGFACALINVSVIAAAVLAVIFIILLLQNYERLTYIIALYVFIDYAVRNIVGHELLSSYWDEILLIIAVALWLYKRVRYRQTVLYRWSPLDFPLIMFFGVGIFLFLINSPDMSISFEGLRAVIQYMFWYFAVVQLLETKKAGRNIYRILVYSGTLMALHGILQYLMKVENPLNWTDAAESDVTRVFSIVGSPNVLGSLMILLIPMAAGLFFAEKKPLKKLLFFCSTAAMGLCLILTFSRGAWLGMAVAAAVYFTFKDKRLFIPFAVAAVLAFLFVPSISSRVAYMLTSDYIASSIRGGRLGRLVEGFAVLKDNLWLGTGFGHFGGAVAMNNIPGSFYMDNYYLKTAVEMGLLGLASFMALVASVIVWCRRAVKKIADKAGRELVLGAFAGMCGVLFHNLFENIFEVPMMVTYFWLAAAFIMFTRQKDQGDRFSGSSDESH